MLQRLQKHGSLKTNRRREVTAIEVFNKEGDFHRSVLWKKKTGIPELQEWKDLVAALEK
jgi:putative hemin transport protein